MSHLVNPILCANFEDYDKYDEVSCTLKTWPDMWPEEIAAEAGVRRERQERKRQAFFLARDKTYKTLQHFRAKSAQYIEWLSSQSWHLPTLLTNADGKSRTLTE